MAVTTLAVSGLNRLLQGEISAVETYVQAIGKLEGEEKPALIRIKADHINACNSLRDLIHGQHGGPEHGSGIWGAWAKLVEGTAKAFGKAAALKALKEGEEHGIREYQELLEDKDIPVEIKNTVSGNFIPAGRNHIEMLDRLIAG